MSFLAGLQIAVKAAPWAAAAVFGIMWWIKKGQAKSERIRADKAELTLNATQADIARKNAALVTIADNAEKLKDEKTRISKSDLDGLIAHARELSNVSGDTGSADSGGDSDTVPNVLSGRIVDG